MKTFVYHENPSGEYSFSKSGDAWSIDDEKQIFAVADSPIRKLTLETREYPFDDHGYEAANTFCTSFVKNTRKHKEELSEDVVREILLECNRDILELNNSLGKKYNDPLNYDVAETVGVGAVIDKDILYYGGVEDCYVNVLRGEKNIAKWDYQIMKASKYVDEVSSEGRLEEYIPEEILHKLRKESYWEPLWCNHLRNNIKALDKGNNLVGWGCFTGEESIKDFLQVYSVKLEIGDDILLFSDGMIPVLQNSEFVEWFLESVNNSAVFQYEMRKRILKMLDGGSDMNKEKTLIYYKYE